MLYLKNLYYHPAASIIPILTNINMELAPQQMGLIIGHSGSGKTTLLEILAGLAKCSKGEILARAKINLRKFTTTGWFSISIPRKTFLWGYYSRRITIRSSRVTTGTNIFCLRRSRTSGLAIKDIAPSIKWRSATSSGLGSTIN